MSKKVSKRVEMGEIGWKSKNAISPMWKKHQNLRNGATMMPLVSQSMGLQYGQTPKYLHCAHTALKAPPLSPTKFLWFFFALLQRYGPKLGLCMLKFVQTRTQRLEILAYPPENMVEKMFATFLSWGSLGHLIVRAFPRGVPGGSSGGT